MSSTCFCVCFRVCVCVIAVWAHSPCGCSVIGRRDAGHTSRTLRARARALDKSEVEAVGDRSSFTLVVRRQLAQRQNVLTPTEVDRARLLLAHLHLSFVASMRSRSNIVRFACSVVSMLRECVHDRVLCRLACMASLPSSCGPCIPTAHKAQLTATSPARATPCAGQPSRSSPPSPDGRR